MATFLAPRVPFLLRSGTRLLLQTGWFGASRFGTGLKGESRAQTPRSRCLRFFAGPAPQPCLPAPLGSYVGSLTKRCRSHQVRHLRPTSWRRRARGTQAAANPGPWSCGATDHSLWGPRSGSSSFQLIQPIGDQVHAGHTHAAAHTFSAPPHTRVLTSPPPLEPHAPSQAHTLPAHEAT